MDKYVWFSQKNKEENNRLKFISALYLFIGIFFVIISPYVNAKFTFSYIATGIIFCIWAMLWGSMKGRDNSDRINFKLDQIAGRDKKLAKIFELKRKMEIEENCS